MLEATLKGKTPESVLNIEDLLTSTVFGYLQYFPVTPVWEKIFASCKALDGKSLYDALRLIETNPGARNLAVHFWPQFSVGEPDLVVELSWGETLYYVIIEVKLWSLKSSYGEDDQLIRYHELMLRDEFKKKMGTRKKYVNLGVVYLTPRSGWQEIRESLNSKEQGVNLYNLRWQDLYEALESTVIDAPFDWMRQKLCQYIFKVGLTPFDGFTEDIDIDGGILSLYPVYSSPASFNGFQCLDMEDLTPIQGFYKRGKNVERY